MSSINVVLILGGVALNTVAQLCLKQGMQSVGGDKSRCIWYNCNAGKCICKSVYLGRYDLLCIKFCCLVGCIV